MEATLLPLLAAAIVAVGALLFMRRYGGAAALEHLERANRILTRRVAELEQENVELHKEINALRARTDVAMAFEPVRELLQTQHAELMACFGRMNGLLERVGDHLGAEPNGR